MFQVHAASIIMMMEAACISEMSVKLHYYYYFFLWLYSPL
jgi:hypothetical protein